MKDTTRRINRLAVYNSEKARGIVHTDEWNLLMNQEQEWFDKVIRVQGYHRVPSQTASIL